jgi:potassium/chloride transporter 4/5/6
MNTSKLKLSNFFKKATSTDSPAGFGTFFGVYLPGILSMFGVVIYLRFGWIIGSLGLFPTLCVVALSCLIVFLTVLSISSVATNMNVGAGGSYYMISRSLGIEIGTAVGVPLFIAQALAVSFCTVGFAESIQPFFPLVPLSYLGVVTLVLLMFLVYSSASIALKTQLIIFLIILGSFASLFLGKSIVLENVSTTFEAFKGPSFWAGFALFFPAATGVESGVSMSGNLRSPRRSLPLGTIGVLLTGLVVYMAIPLFMWTHAPRELLISDALIFQHIAKFQSLIIAGIWAATLSSILSGLLAAPRTLQALAQDGVLPNFLAKEWGKNKEPRIATLCCFVIALTGVLFGSIDKIAPLLTMFYLVAYATLNLATGLEDLQGNPSWRPTFKVHWTVSLSGVFLCMLAMFMIDAGATFLALFFVVALFIFMRKRNLTKRWEDIWHGMLVFLSRFAIYKLAANAHCPRSWRPNFLVLSDSPMQISKLIQVSSAISKGKGFLTLASVFPPNSIDYERAERWKKMVTGNLKEHKIEALVELCADESPLSGAKKLLTNYGMGSISPNTLVIGEMKKLERSKEYFEIIQAACLAKKNVMIIRDQKLAIHQKNTIHIWWDEHLRSNAELMLLLSHMLKSNRSYRKSTIELHSIVFSELGREQRLKHFQDFFAKSRFSVTPHIHIKSREASPWDIMSTTSKEADIVLIGMLPPKEGESLEGFENYYTEMITNSALIPNAIFVIGSETIDLSEIFV